MKYLLITYFIFHFSTTHAQRIVFDTVRADITWQINDSTIRHINGFFVTKYSVNHNRYTYIYDWLLDGRKRPIDRTKLKHLTYETL
jgi:hypothetical protein